MDKRESKVVGGPWEVGEAMCVVGVVQVGRQQRFEARHTHTVAVRVYSGSSERVCWPRKNCSCAA